MMKNLLLLGLALATGVGAADAQTARYRGLNKTAEPINFNLSGEAYFKGIRKGTSASNNQRSMTAGYFGTQIGKSWYDLPSNAAVANRIFHNNTDNTISVVWNETCTGPSAAQGYPSRGAGYNYFNGTVWTEGLVANTNPPEYIGTCNDPASAYGIASKRVGWPEIMQLSSGKEVVISHNSSFINITSRPTKGTGGMAAWSNTTDLGFTGAINKPSAPAIPGNAGTWPRAVSSGNTIHLIYAVNGTTTANSRIDGVLNPVVYSRSTDGGATWDKQNVFLPGLDSVNGGFTRIGGDGYAIAANGSNVAIVAGYFGQPWSIWKSTDGGNTFVKRTIKRTATPADTIMITATDTAAMYNDNSHSVVIDNNGVVHVWAGSIFVKGGFKANGDFKPGDSWYPGLGASLQYWNDAMPTNARPIEIAGIEDSIPGHPAWIGFDSNHRTPYGTMGMVSMPNGAYDAAGNVYVIYDAVVRGAAVGNTNTGQPFRDMYIIKRFANTGNWSKPINISRSKNLFSTAPGSSSAEQGEENVFPSVSHAIGSDNKLHTTWMTDYEPGMNLGADVDPETENAIMYEGFDLNAFNFLGTAKDLTAFVNNINAYPNPTNGNVTLALDLKKNASVKVRVTNLLGQEVATVAPTAMAAGKNNTVTVDMSNFANGVYLYTISSDDFTVTKRIVKQ